MKNILLKFAFLFLMAPLVRAGLPEPDNILYGQIIVTNEPVMANRTDIVVEARRTLNGPAIATYRIGSDPKFGNFFSLRIPMETIPASSGNNVTIIGDALIIMVRDASGPIGQKNYVVASRGSTTRVDFSIGSPDSNQNGIPDAWETAHFGGPIDPNADPDGDGQSNLQEFIANTNPMVRDGFVLQIANLGGLTQITFTAVAAFGLGYENLARYYAIESTTNLTGTWIGVAGYSNILGANQSVIFLDPVTNPPTFYRGRVWLREP